MAHIENAPSDNPALLADFISADELIRQLGITHDTRRRYEQQPESYFPIGVKIGRRRLYLRRAVADWLKMRVGEPIDDAA